MIQQIKITLELLTDNYGSETTWTVTSSTGAVLYSGGPYTNAPILYEFEFEFTAYDCITFNVPDSYGDGICCAYGNGYYKLIDENDFVFIEGGEFADEESKTFEYTWPVSIDEMVADEINIYPNPTDGILYISGLNNGQIDVYSITGAKVAQFENNIDGQIDLSEFENGIYMLMIKTENEIIYEKVYLN